MPMKIKIRPATVYDYVKIMRLLIDVKDPPGIRVGRLNADKTFQFILAVIQGGYVAVADLGGNIVGVMALSAFRPPWSNDVVLSLENFYVQPAHRQGGVPRALLSNVLREARRANVELKLHLCDRDIEMIGAATLETSGLKPAGRVFLLGRQEDAAIHGTGGATQRNDVGGELADDESEPVLPRSPGDDDAGDTGPAYHEPPDTGD